MLQDWITKEYLQQEKKETLRTTFLENKPFAHLVLGDFFNAVRLREVAKALEDEAYSGSECDLYKFQQTKDLVHSHSNVIKQFHTFFTSQEFVKYIEDITGIAITDVHVDMHSLLFRDTDYLLCHDDQIENRRIAYVLNLAKHFTKKDGGALQLFDCVRGKPVTVVKSLIPAFNTFILFKVSATSFHQVEEVMGDKRRSTIGGWFNEGASKDAY